MSATRLLGLKGKEKLFEGIKNYIEAKIDYAAEELPKEELDKVEAEFKLMIMDLEWRLE